MPASSAILNVQLNLDGSDVFWLVFDRCLFKRKWTKETAVSNRPRTRTFNIVSHLPWPISWPSASSSWLARTRRPGRGGPGRRRPCRSPSVAGRDPSPWAPGTDSSRSTWCRCDNPAGGRTPSGRSRRRRRRSSGTERARSFNRNHRLRHSREVIVTPKT